MKGKGIILALGCFTLFFLIGSSILPSQELKIPSSFQMTPDKESEYGMAKIVYNSVLNEYILFFREYYEGIITL